MEKGKLINQTIPSLIALYRLAGDVRLIEIAEKIADCDEGTFA